MRAAVEVQSWKYRHWRLALFFRGHIIETS